MKALSILLQYFFTQDPNDFNQFLYPLNYNDNQQGKKEDEFKQYMKIKSVIIKPGELINIYRWWKAHESQWPSLARMAFNIIAIPAISSEYKRLFSSIKLLFFDCRARMKEDIIE